MFGMVLGRRKAHLAAMSPSRGAVTVGVAITLFLAVASGAALARNGLPPFIDILYAEDGTRFYSEARTMGMGSIIAPYAGYMHFVPRVASLMLVALPAGGVAAGYAVTATTLIALLALYAFFASRVLLDSWQSRALLAAAMVIPPVAGQTIANLTNLHWYLMFAAFWAVISNPRHAWWTVAGATVGVAAALSDPLTALLLPAAALAVYRYRSRSHGYVVAAVMVGLGAQLLIVLGAEQRIGSGSPLVDLPALYAFRVAGGITIGDVHLTSAWLTAGWSLAVVAMVAVTVVVVLAIAWTQMWRKVIVVTAVVNSIAFFAAPLIVRGTEGMIPAVGQPPPLFSGRYTLVPALFVVVCVAVLVDLAVVERQLKNVLVGGIVAAWLVGVIAANYIIAPLPNGPSWTEGVDAARQECIFEPIDYVEVAIAPPSWKVRLACADLSFADGTAPEAPLWPT